MRTTGTGRVAGARMSWPAPSRVRWLGRVTAIVPAGPALVYSTPVSGSHTENRGKYRDYSRAQFPGQQCVAAGSEAGPGVSHLTSVKRDSLGSDSRSIVRVGNNRRSAAVSASKTLSAKVAASVVGRPSKSSH